MGQTLYDKIWDAHRVYDNDDGVSLIYIDRHLVHEVTSPQAFEGLRLKNRPLRRPDTIMATVDHNVPTKNPQLGIKDPLSRQQIEVLRQNCKDFGIPLYDLGSPQMGIVHVIGPEQGFTQPGTTIVCGDSHTSTHGAFGALAFGIGTSEIEHVMATQTLQLKKSKSLLIQVDGDLPSGTSAKDLALYVIRQLGTAGGTGYVMEYRGSTISSLSMEARMTICNLAIEAGSRSALIAPDDKTFAYLKGRPFSPQSTWDQAVSWWQNLRSDDDAKFDKTLTISASDITPHVSWGTSPEQSAGITESVPNPDDFSDHADRKSCEQALAYMDIQSGTPISELGIDYVFIGSCTNSRIEDLRAAANIVQGKKMHPQVKGIVVPGSIAVKTQAEAEGLDEIFKQVGFEWREPGCSMCLGMNEDILQPGQRCASTSNRNFEGRQGRGARTFLVSPEMAGAAAIEGHFVDIRSWT